MHHKIINLMLLISNLLIKKTKIKQQLNQWHIETILICFMAAYQLVNWLFVKKNQES